ncbi:putative dnaJ-like subfamily B member 14-like [Cocos nucifera]|nr:putative dnaJ-like subfamily B member 14-like [Cocos nucifera]
MAKAEEKFKAKDIDGAKKLALKAKTLFPSLPGVPQAIAAYEVHIAGKKRKRGETHWCYAVLGADPSGNLQATKQRYKKLCVQTHPDKNRSAAADGAFKLVKEAWDKISESSAEAQSGGAKNTAGPKDSEGANTATNARNGPNAHRGTKTTNKNSSSGGRANAHRGPTNANGSSHACGEGNNAFGTADARHGYCYREFSNADGSHHEFHYYYHDGTSANASTGFGSINVLCSNCGRQAMNLDAAGLAIRCYQCNMLEMREEKDGKFRIMLQYQHRQSYRCNNQGQQTR